MDLDLYQKKINVKSIGILRIKGQNLLGKMYSQEYMDSNFMLDQLEMMKKYYMILEIMMYTSPPI
jgi:hypothetical protein